MRRILIMIMVVIFMSSCGRGSKVEEPERLSIDDVLVKVNEALRVYDPVSLDVLIGVEDGDSYLAREWAFANGVPLHEEYLKKVGMLTKVTPVGVVGVDYAALTRGLDKEYVGKLYRSSGLAEDEYGFSDGMFLLLLQYLCDQPDLPVIEVSHGGLNLVGEKIESDAELDDILFGSEGFRGLMSAFSKEALGYDGYGIEKYKDKDRVNNPEYGEWLKLFNERYQADGGVFVKGRSLWEPFYLRDTNNVIVKDVDGKNVVDYYSVKRDDGTDWIQPPKEIEVEVEKERKVSLSWAEERGVGYNKIGMHWLETGYRGKGSTVVRLGNGLRERPLGVGTSYVSKMRGRDGLYRDVEVTLLGYWVGKDAIDYVERFSPRNRGFTVDNIVKLICFEVAVRNLSDEVLEFEGTEMALCDAGGNVSPRNGVLYEFTDSGVIQPGELVILNDWATSTELERKYVCWGETFGKEYPVLFYNALAGRIEVPSYSHYKEFDGVSLLLGK